jgi:hypothetical protein
MFAVFNAYDQLIHNCSGVSKEVGKDLCDPNTAVTSGDISLILGTSVFQGVTGLIGFDGNDPISTNVLLDLVPFNDSPFSRGV